MQVIVSKETLKSLIDHVVKEDRSFHSKNANELEKAAPPILPRPEMAQQLTTSMMPVEDKEFVPSNKDELGKATMQLSHNVEDEMIEEFYTNFKNLVKKFDGLNEAKLPTFLGQSTDEPRKNSAAERRRAKSRDADPEQAYAPSTPEEDAQDIAGSIEIPQDRVKPPPESTGKRRRAKPEPKVDLGDSGSKNDPVAEFLRSLYRPRPRPEWMKNYTMDISDMVVGDANKLLAAIIKTMGEENVTVENLESAAMSAIDNLKYAIDGNYIVISSPEYKVSFRYNTEGKQQNLFSLEQYQQILRDLASQKSTGVGSQSSWGPKYAAAIKELAYARNDQELESALLESLQLIQTTLTDAVLDSYPAGTVEFNTTAVADKLDIANDQVIDAFIQQGLKPGLNTTTVDIFDNPVTVSISIPASSGALKAIEDARFGNVLLRLLSATPDELRAYVAKKKRERRSAVQMSRGDENYFYDLGMKLGGKNFKMSAAEFQERLQSALDARDDAGLELSDEDIVNMILTRKDIIDPKQIEILAKVQDYVYTLFENYMQSSPVLLKKIDIDTLLDAIPENLGGLNSDLRDVFDKFFKDIVMIYTDKQVITPFFKYYDSIVDDPATKLHFKETAGVKHSQIYDQPGAGRRAKDITNFVGNLRHIAEFIKDKAKLMKRSGSTILAGNLDRAASDLIDPDVVADSMKIFFKKLASAPKPIQIEVEKAVKRAAGELLKRDLTNRVTSQDTSTTGQLTPAQATVPDVMPAATPSFDSNSRNKTYDDIIAAYARASDLVKDKMLDSIEDTVALGEISKDQLQRYPALTTPDDYKVLLDKLNQLTESTSQSRLLNLIHSYNRG